MSYGSIQSLCQGLNSNPCHTKALLFPEQLREKKNPSIRSGMDGQRFIASVLQETPLSNESFIPHTNTDTSVI